jgi:hypothetical protein
MVALLDAKNGRLRCYEIDSDDRFNNAKLATFLMRVNSELDIGYLDRVRFAEMKKLGMNVSYSTNLPDWLSASVSYKSNIPADQFASIWDKEPYSHYEFPVPRIDDWPALIKFISTTNLDKYKDCMAYQSR